MRDFTSRLRALEGNGDGYTEAELCRALGAFAVNGALPPPGPLASKVAALASSLAGARLMTYGAPTVVDGNAFHQRMHRRLAPWREGCERLRAALAMIEQEAGDWNDEARGEVAAVFASGWTMMPPARGPDDHGGDDDGPVPTPDAPTSMAATT